MMKDRTRAMYGTACALLSLSLTTGCELVEETPEPDTTHQTNNTTHTNNSTHTNNTSETNNTSQTNNTVDPGTTNNTTNNTSQTNNTTNNTVDPGTTNNTTTPPDPPQSPWQVMAHPCVGNRTDALHCDDASTCYVGCGTTTNGRGLFVTYDAGQSWTTLQTDPADFLAGSRVNDISRSADGKLYVGGEHSNGFRVVSVDPQGTIGEVFKAGSTVDYSFTVGTFKRADSGRAIAESLTGAGLVYREDDADAWTTGHGFWQGQGYDGGVQILDLATHDDKFYGAGSTISQPPIVYLPAWDGSFGMEILTLSPPGGLSSYRGEMWGIDVSDDGIIVGGVNQGARRGMIYTFDFDGVSAPQDLANWRAYNLQNMYPGKATWVQGVCRGESNVVYAVGREAREGWGFVLRSRDGGQSWDDISPFASGATRSSLKEVYRCQATDDGVIIAGEAGLFAIYTD